MASNATESMEATTTGGGVGGGAGGGAGAAAATTTAAAASSNEGAGKRVLVTGVTGYIANHVYKQLLDAGYTVRGTSRSTTGVKIDALKALAPSGAKVEFVKADLLDASCWPDIVKGCDYVCHLASPFPASTPKDENEIIKPAVEGTVNVLKACAQTPTVRRVVLTASVVSVGYGHPYDVKREYTEKDWTNVDNCGAYPKSKTLAEQAAWKFVKENDGPNKFELATVNPGLVMGPPLTKLGGTSIGICSRIMNREMPAVPEIGMALVDVRDVARAHVMAMTDKKAPGERFLAVATNTTLTKMARALAPEFDPHGYNIPTKRLHKALLWVAWWFDKSIGDFYDTVGKKTNFNGTKLSKVLGMKYIDPDATMRDMGHALIRLGIVEDKSKGKVLSKAGSS